MKNKAKRRNAQSAKSRNIRRPELLTVPFLAMHRFLAGDRSLLPDLDRLMLECGAVFAHGDGDALVLSFVEAGYYVHLFLYLSESCDQEPENWRFEHCIVEPIRNESGKAAPPHIAKKIKDRVNRFSSKFHIELLDSIGLCVPARALTPDELRQALEMEVNQS